MYIYVPAQVHGEIDEEQNGTWGRLSGHYAAKFRTIHRRRNLWYIDHIMGYFSFRPHIVACQAKKVSSCHVSTGRVHTPCSLFEDKWDDDIVAEDE